MDLTDRVALVTGAGHRIGRAIALALAAAGARVAVHYGRSERQARETVGEIAGMGVDSRSFGADLRQPAEIERLFDRVGESFGRLDVLVNSAASFVRRRLDEIETAEWDAVLALNLRAPFLCTRLAARRMRESERGGTPGLVVNVADLSGVQAWREYAHHGVSKAGLLHLTRLAARELAPDVRVNALVPGAILPPPGVAADSKEWRQRGGRVPLARTGDPREVGRAVVFLAEGDFVTGAVLPVDGGEHLTAGP